MVFARRQQVVRHRDPAEVDADTAHFKLAGNARRLLFRYRLRMYQAAKGPGRLVESGIPVEQVEGRRLLPLR